MPSLREPRSDNSSHYRSIRAAARELGVAEITVRRAVLAGRMPAVQVCGRWRIPGSYFTELERAAYGRSASESIPRKTPVQVQKKAAIGRTAVEWKQSVPPNGGLEILRPALHRQAAATSLAAGGQ